MAETLTFGEVHGKEPIPHSERDTVIVDAGAVRIGVEYRIVTPEAIQQYIEDLKERDPAAAAEIDPDDVTLLEDEGVSLHVFDTDSGREYLRFDCFEGDPHYHYITPGERNFVVAYDGFANGPILEWALGQINRRLAPMLEFAGAPQLAETVRDEPMDAPVKRVREVIEEARASARRS